MVLHVVLFYSRHLFKKCIQSGERQISTAPEFSERKYKQLQYNKNSFDVAI